MAENLVEGLLGGEAEEGEAGASKRTLDPLAAAAAIQASAGAMSLDPKLAAYLEEQTNLARLEQHHFEQERQLAIGAAKRKRLSDQLRIAFQILLALIVTAIGTGLLTMVHDAFASNSVVIDPFVAPPALAARGLNGEVIAGGVLDRLTQFQASTRASVHDGGAETTTISSARSRSRHSMAGTSPAALTVVCMGEFRSGRRS